MGPAVLITGAGRGLGWGIARGLARAGARVCAVDLAGPELDAAAAEASAERGAGGEVFARAADVRDPAALAACVEACVARWGRLDGAIANAAIMPLTPFAELAPAEWQTVLDVNLTGVFNTFKAAWPILVRQGGGHLVTIASGSSVAGFPNEVAYCAAKHGLEGLVKALAMEAEPYGIAVNAVGPGLRIKPTSLTRAMAAAAPAEARAQWRDPAELAPAFLWLLSQPPERYTGLRLDAGPIAAAVAAEGLGFAFAPEKVAQDAADVAARIEERRTRGGAWPAR